MPKHIKEQGYTEDEFFALSARKRYELRYPDRLYLQRSKQWKAKFTSKYLLQKEYAEIFEYQKGVCAICKKPETSTQRKLLYEGQPPIEVIKRLAIDHDHITNQVRGLLCSKCNALLGMAGDNTEILFSAIEYLESNE